MRFSFIRTLPVAGLAAILPLAAQPRYVVYDLGTLGGASASANDINALGQVTGSSATAGGQTHAFRTAPNRPIVPAADDLGTLGGASSFGERINDSGQVAGSSSTGAATRAFRSSANGAPVALTDLGTFDGTLSSFGRGINTSGQVAGQAHVASTSTCSFIFSNSAFRTTANGTVSGGDNLGTLVPNNCRSASGIAINDSGVVVGESATVLATGIPNHAFRAAPGSPMVDIHDPVFASSIAYDINNAGQIVGAVITAAENRFCYRTAPGQSIVFNLDDLGELGFPYCEAFGINSAGDVVGASATPAPAVHAFLYKNGVMRDLNSLLGAASGVVLTMARGINDSGQIAAGGFISGNPNSRAFRLDPAGVAVANLAALLSDPSLALTSGQIASLTDKLNNALTSIQDGQYKQAVNQLNAALSSVNAWLKTGRIGAGAAATLASTVNAIIAALS